MINASVREKLEREIARVENHLDALYDILDEVLIVAPRRKPSENGADHIPLIRQALSKVRGTRVFSVKEITAFARRIDPEIDRRLIYNCTRGFLKRGVEIKEFIQVSPTEYKRAVAPRKEED